MRFEGPLNIDLNEVTTTLVPFPRMHFLMSSLSPLYALADVVVAGSGRQLDAMFSDAFQRSNYLLRCDAKRHTNMAVALMLRGDVPISAVNANVTRLKRELRMSPWNPDGFKVGICAASPLHVPTSLLTLSNNCGVGATLGAAYGRFMQLYRAKAHVHHYTEYMDEALFTDAAGNVMDLVHEYAQQEVGGAGGADE
jgi:tubulin epsilon